MTNGIKGFISDSSGRNKRNQKHLTIFGSVSLYIMEPLPENVNILEVIEILEDKIPRFLVTPVDAMYVGTFKEFKEKQINAMYRDGAIYVSSDQDNVSDMVDDIIHEVAHATEEINSREIYSDGEIQDEFLGKRERLKAMLSEYGYLDGTDVDFSELEYSKEFDNLLYNTIGYDIIETFSMGLFIKPYAATDIREYFATAFEEYLFGDNAYVRRISPVAFRKVHLVCTGEV